MPTKAAESRANRSADARLLEYSRRLAKAATSDREAESAADKLQWGVLVGWLLAESKNVDQASRRKMFDHLVTCARQMNEASRHL